MAFGNVENTDWVYTETVSAAGSLSANLPPVSVGDAIALVVYSRVNSQTINTPSGYTAASFNVGDTVGFMGLFWKISDGTETTVSLVHSSGTANIQCIALKITSPNASAPLNVSAVAGVGGGSNWNSPSITTTADGCVLFFGGGSNGTSDWVAADEPDSTTLVKQDTTSDTWLGLAFENQASAGATGTRQWTNAVSPKRAFSFAIAPAGGATVSITSVTGSASDVIRAGESVTIVGTGFNASQGDGSVTIAGVAGAVTMTIGSWSNTSITCTAPAEGIMFGGSKTVTVTNSDESSDTHSVTYNPPTGWIYETLSDATPPSDSMAAGAAGLAVGDQVYLNTTADGPGAATATVAFLGAGDGTVELTGVTVDGDYDVTVEIRDATDGLDTSNGPQTITVDTIAPVGYTISVDQAAVNSGNVEATSFTFAGAEVGSTWDLTVTSSGGGTPVEDTGTVSAADEQILNIDVSSLPNGTLNYTVTLTDTVGNVGDGVFDTVVKTVNPPTNILLSNSIVLTTAGSDASVGALSTVDVDIGDSYTYSLVAGTGDTDNADFSISGSTLRIDDPEALGVGTYSVRIQTDDGSATFAKAFTIQVREPSTTGLLRDICRDICRDPVRNAA